MNTLVLGSDGLLGSHFCSRYPRTTLGVTRKNFDIADYHKFSYYVKEFNVSTVINCAGITERHPDQKRMQEINAEVPHKLAAICTRHEIKYIHMSTDCVFSGLDGDFTEASTPAPQTLYGKTKLDGEVTSGNHLTVRTSFIGFPDKKGRGLLSWLYNYPEKDVPGYVDHIWNGLSTIAVCDYLRDFSASHRSGLVHLSGQAMSKFSLLELVNDIFGWGKTIIPVEAGYKDRTLKSIRPPAYIPGTRNQEEMLKELLKWQKKLKA